MRGEAEFTVPELARVLGTRLALGVGLGFLLGNGLSEDKRGSVGWTLLFTGAFSAATLAMEIFGKPRSLHIAFGEQERPQPVETERYARGFTRT